MGPENSEVGDIYPQHSTQATLSPYQVLSDKLPEESQGGHGQESPASSRDLRVQPFGNGTGSCAHVTQA